jgi:hypothetical protein
MIKPDWIELANDIPISAKPKDCIWQCAYSYIEGPGLLKIEATGTWKYLNTAPQPCSPNGDLESPLDGQNNLHGKSPLGALIGRIGGSIADRDTTSVFAVGSFCVRKLDKEAGPLFLTINDAWNGFDDNEGTLTIKLSFAAQIVKATTVTELTTTSK